MKNTVIPTVISAFILSAVTVLSPMENVFAKNITPVYEDFNANDVNGKITVEIPEKASAEIKINFTSPEVTDEQYYITDADGGNSYSFDIEGRDTTDDDYRNYTLSVAVTSGDYNDTIVYTDTFTMPDGLRNGLHGKWCPSCHLHSGKSIFHIHPLDEEICRRLEL